MNLLIVKNVAASTCGIEDGASWTNQVTGKNVRAALQAAM